MSFILQCCHLLPTASVSFSCQTVEGGYCYSPIFIVFFNFIIEICARSSLFLLCGLTLQSMQFNHIIFKSLVHTSHKTDYITITSPKGYALRNIIAVQSVNHSKPMYIPHVQNGLLVILKQMVHIVTSMPQRVKLKSYCWNSDRSQHEKWNCHLDFTTFFRFSPFTNTACSTPLNPLLTFRTLFPVPSVLSYDTSGLCDQVPLWLISD